MYARTRDLSSGEAETVLRGWLRGEIPSLDGWRHMERDGRTWRQAAVGQVSGFSAPPQPNPSWTRALSEKNGNLLVHPVYPGSVRPGLEQLFCGDRFFHARR